MPVRCSPALRFRAALRAGALACALLATPPAFLRAPAQAQTAAGEAIDIYLADGSLREALNGLILAAGLSPRVAVDASASISARRVRGGLAAALDRLAAEKDLIWVSTGSAVYVGPRARPAEATIRFVQADAPAVRRLILRLNLETRPELLSVDGALGEVRARGPEPFVEMVRAELRAYETRAEPAPTEVKVIRFGKTGALE